jgi:hypothetical protein
MNGCIGVVMGMSLYMLLVMRIYVLLVMRIRMVMGMGMTIGSMVVAHMVMSTINRVPSIMSVLSVM